MANSLGTLNSAIIIQAALALVFTQRPVLNSISLGLRDLDGSVSGAKLGQQVITRIKSVPTVSAFGTATPDDIVTTDIPTTLDTEKQVYAKFTRAEWTGTGRNLVDEAAEPCAVALANNMLDAIAALWVAATFTNSTTVATGWTRANTILPLRNAMQTRGVPESNRFFVSNVGVYGALLNDPMVVAAQNNPSNADAIRTGKLPKVDSFGISEYPALPTTGNMVGFAGTPDSTVYAQRAHMDPREALDLANPGFNFGIVTEPRTGLSVDVTEWIDPLSLDANCRIGWLYGLAAGNPNNGQILKTA